MTALSGIIYIITDGEFVKVGWTSSSVITRLVQLQTGNAKKLRVLASVSANCAADESTLHRYMREKGLEVRNEWFRNCPALFEAFVVSENISSVFTRLGLERPGNQRNNNAAQFAPSVLTRKRLAAGMSSRDLSLSAGLGANTVLCIEKGQNDPSVNTVGAICSALGCHPGELFVVDPTPQPEPAE